MRLAIVVHVTGTLLRLFSPAFLAPAAVAFLYGESRDGVGFLITAIATAVLGSVVRRVSRTVDGEFEQLRRAEGLTIVALTWMVIAHVAAVPFMWAGLGFVDALFESMSGLTTTG